MSESQYARGIHRILASLSNEPGDRQDDQRLPDEEEAVQEIHVYPVEGGGLLFTKEPLEEEDGPPVTIVDSEPPAVHPTRRGEPPHFLSFVLLLLLFLVLDSADTALSALLAPSATITITPQVHTLTLQSTATLGKLLSPITLSESQTVPATGHGHQNARQATGTLTLYNGLFTSQFVAQGTVLTGSDGVQIATDHSVTVPANSPPVDGQATVTAHALHPGASGNIVPGDITITINNGLLVKNSQLSGGESARDFQVVTRADITAAGAILHAKVTASMTAALHGQLLPGQALQATPCPARVTADHAVGDEASTVEVTVAESCSAIAYDAQALTAQAAQLLATQVAHTFGPGYTLAGDVQVQVTHITTHFTTPLVALAFTCQGTYAYLLNGQAQQRIKALLAGKPRLTALHLLLQQRGIHTASISGIPANQLLPDDQTHLHLLIISLSW